MRKKSEIIVNIASMLVTEDSNGPGKLISIHFQGCALNCPGCYNPEMQVNIPYHLLYVSEILEICNDLLNEDESIEGVSLLGGEPLDQPDAVLMIAREIKPTGRNVLLFTGYEKSELKKYHAWAEIEQFLDCAITGRFSQDLVTKTGYPSSSNQEVTAYNSRYSSINSAERFTTVIMRESDMSAIITGYPKIQEKLMSYIEIEGNIYTSYEVYKEILSEVSKDIDSLTIDEKSLGECKKFVITDKNSGLVIETELDAEKIGFKVVDPEEELKRSLKKSAATAERIKARAKKNTAKRLEKRIKELVKLKIAEKAIYAQLERMKEAGQIDKYSKDPYVLSGATVIQALDSNGIIYKYRITSKGEVTLKTDTIKGEDSVKILAGMTKELTGSENFKKKFPCKKKKPKEEEKETYADVLRKCEERNRIWLRQQENQQRVLASF